jgi:anti-sigma B factor antagonist
MNPDADSTAGIFRIQVHRNGQSSTIEPAGELDLATARQLEEQVETVIRQGCDVLVLDLKGLTFIDSSGVRLVANLAKRARDDGFELELVRGQPNVQRVFELTGLVKTLPFGD